MRSRYFIIIVVALLGGPLCLLFAAPEAGARETSASIIQVGEGSPSEKTSATFDADFASVTATGTFSYTVRVRPAPGADSVWARFELFNLSGRSIYLRTKYWNFQLPGGADAGSANRSGAQYQQLVPQQEADVAGYYTYTFTRDLTNLDLQPGDYEVHCTIRTSTIQGSDEQQLTSHLLVYDPRDAAAPVALVLRISAPPLRSCDGLFASDPATGVAQLRIQQLDRLANEIKARPQLHLAIAPSPLLLEDLTTLAGGCRYLDDTGEAVTLDASSAPARAATRALDNLRAATRTGRLQVAWQGYADPDVGAMTQFQLSGDLSTQYKQGAEVVQKVLGVAPAAFTAPYGDRSVEQARADLESLGINEVLLASYNKVSQALESGAAIDALAGLFSQRGQAKATPVVIGLPAARQKSDALMDRIETLQDCAWLSFVAPDGAPLRSASADPGQDDYSYEAPKREYLAVYQARMAALGLAQATASDNPDAREATRLSLIAEGAFGPKPAVGAISKAQASAATTTATAAETYTQAALRVVKQAFSVLSLKAHPVTLAGSSGEVPITIVNSGATQMQVHLEFSSVKPGMQITPAKSPALTVASNDTLFSPDVALRNTVTDDLRVRLMAGKYLICEDTIAISGSYLDIIGIVAIVVIVGAGLIFYIWRRTRRMQKGEPRGC